MKRLTLQFAFAFSLTLTLAAQHQHGAAPQKPTQADPAQQHQMPPQKPTQGGPAQQHQMPPQKPTQADPAQQHQMPPQKPNQGDPAQQHQMPPQKPTQGGPAQQHQMPQKPLEQLIQESPSQLVRPLGGQPQGGAPGYTLEQLEQLAREKNPTLLQAEAEVRAAKGRRTQAGLLPNPTIGYAGEKIRGGELGGGQHGAFVEQTFILGGKLRLARNVAQQEITMAEIEVEEQKQRVQNSVRRVYFEVLADQEQLGLERSGAAIAAEMHQTAQRLRNIGMADASEVLQAEIEVHRAQLGLMMQEHRLRRQWKLLASVVGEPALERRTLAGRLDQDLPPLDVDRLVESLVQSSPAIRIAEANAARSQALLARARREYVPDLSLRAGLQQSREEVGLGRRIGLLGFAEVGITLPIFNRNQGNVQAGLAELDRARADQTRVGLVLRERAASVVQDYSDARATVEAYAKQVLPKARQVYEMNLKAWGQMGTSYPQVLAAQRNLYELQSEYIAALRALHASSIALQGYLLTDGLEAPARPGEVDMPVRELNLPSSRVER